MTLITINQRTEWNPPAGGSYSGRSPYSSKTWTGAGYGALGVALTLPDLAERLTHSGRRERPETLACRVARRQVRERASGGGVPGTRHSDLHPEALSGALLPALRLINALGGDGTFQNSTARAGSFGENMLLTSVPSRALSRTNASTAIKPGMFHVRLLVVLFNVKS